VAFCYRENALQVIDFYTRLCLFGRTCSVSIEGAKSTPGGKSFNATGKRMSAISLFNDTVFQFDNPVRNVQYPVVVCYQQNGRAGLLGQFF
jgi:hypothetical protein